jgi:hypothetical protein
MIAIELVESLYVVNNSRCTFDTAPDSLGLAKSFLVDSTELIPILSEDFSEISVISCRAAIAVDKKHDTFTLLAIHHGVSVVLDVTAARGERDCIYPVWLWPRIRLVVYELSLVLIVLKRDLVSRFVLNVLRLHVASNLTDHDTLTIVASTVIIVS